MKNMRLWIRKFFLICYDICVVIGSCMLALLVRFDFHFRNIPDNYLTTALDILWIASIITFICFYWFRLYSSLWSYAGSIELMYICCACFVDAVLLAVFMNWQHSGQSSYPVPRSFYFLYGIFFVDFYYIRTLLLPRSPYYKNKIVRPER